MHGLQAEAVVDQRYERQIAALSAQVAAVQKEASVQQELCRGAMSAQVAAAQKEATRQQELFRGATRELASLRVMHDNFRVRV